MKRGQVFFRPERDGEFVIVDAFDLTDAEWLETAARLLSKFYGVADVETYNSLYNDILLEPFVRRRKGDADADVLRSAILDWLAEAGAIVYIREEAR
jgi:hypothetical protein